MQLEGFDERTSIQILDFKSERDIEKSRIFAIFCIHGSHSIQQNFSFIFFLSKEFYKNS